MNSTQKKSHGTTPFRVMWGIDSRHADLVPVVNSVTISSQDDIDTEEAILNYYDPLLDEFHQMIHLHFLINLMKTLDIFKLYFRLDQKSKKVTVLSTLTCKN